MKFSEDVDNLIPSSSSGTSSLSGMTRQYDVVVVGGGPAGSTCGRLCAEQGLSVCLVEEHGAAGIPVQCAGLLSMNAFRECEVSQSSILATVRGAKVVSSLGPVLEFDARMPKAHVVDRAVLDREMLARAAGAGAEVRMKTSFADRKGQRIVTRGVNGKEEILFRILVAADGARSRVARVMGMRRPEVFLAGLQADILHGMDGSRVEIHPDAAPDFFGWAIPIGAGRARVGLAGRTGVRERFRSFLSLISQDSHQAQVHLVSGTIPLGTMARTFGDRVLFVGDAAGMAKPTSGGGVYTGVRAARHAARVAGEAVALEDFGDGMLSRYERAWKEDFGRELEQGMQVFRLRQQISPGDMAKIVSALSDPAIVEDIVELGDMDRPGRLARRLLTRPSLYPLLGILIRSGVRLIYE
jgi:geranylgeranyl reductase family protein